MRFVIDMYGGNGKVLLTYEQLEILATALDGAEMLKDIDVGKDNGDHGYANQYIYGIKPWRTSENLNVKLMSSEEYETLKFITKQQEKK